MISTIGRIVPKAGQRKLVLKRVSISDTKADPSSFYGIEYLLEFESGENFLVALTPREGKLTDEDFERYELKNERFGGGPVGLLRSGPYKAIEDAEGRLVGISKAYGRKRADAIWNGSLPEEYEQC